MIPRYTRPPMAALWSDHARLTLWLEVEILALEAMTHIGAAPPEALDAVRAKAFVDQARMEEIENDVHHDFIAFLTCIGEQVGGLARFVHRGLTSSDVIDTALSVQMARSTDMLDRGLERVLAALRARALEHRDTVCIGRTHGVHAEPMTFGLKLASFHAEFARNRRRLAAAREEIAVCSLSGAVGTSAHMDPAIEAHVADKLGLRRETIATQVIPRDRHAMYFATLGVVASSVERIAVELRHLQRTEVLEVEEAFGKAQRGSSAMPHKRNPVLAENLTGLARIVRSMVIPALENVALWHERDISHSSVERITAPGAAITLDFALHRLAGIIEGLVVHPDRMAANLGMLGGLVHSQEVLLALVDSGMARDEAYRITQRNAMAAWAGKGRFRDLVAADPDVALPPEALDALFDPKTHLRRIDAILARVFGDDG